MFVRLTPEVFKLARKKFAVSRTLDFEVSRDVGKSWTYIQEGWNTIARNPVATKIEKVVGGRIADPYTAQFELPKTGKKTVILHLELPQSFDSHLPNVIEIMSRFKQTKRTNDQPCRSNKGNPTPDPADNTTNAPASSAASFPQLPTNPNANVVKIALTLSKLVDKRGSADRTLEDLPSSEKTDWLGAAQTLIQVYISGAAAATCSRNEAQITAALAQDLEEMFSFAQSVPCRDAKTTLPIAVLKRWTEALGACSSPWCPAPIWWCVGRALVGGKLSGLLRSDSDTSAAAFSRAATDLQNWDMLAFIHLLQSDLFPSEVHTAAEVMDEYTRRDLAHERLGCDWHRDFTCMVQLLDGLGEDSSSLRKFCNLKPHSSNAGDTFCLQNSLHHG